MSHERILLTNENLKQPVSLWSLSLSYSLFMVIFCNLLASITLYLMQDLHLSQTQSYQMFGAYASMLFTLPLLGGYLCGRYGYRSATLIGLAFCVIGTACLIAQIPTLTYLGLSAFLAGNAFFTPGCWCLVDHIYGKDDRRREVGFTLFYLLFNVGGVLGILIGGYISETFSPVYTFIGATILLVLNLMFTGMTLSSLKFGEGRFVKAAVDQPRLKLTLKLFACGVLMIAMAILLFNYAAVNNVLTVIAAVLAALSLLWIAKRQPKGQARSQVIAFTVLTVFAGLFWTMYNLEPSLISVFVSTNVYQDFFGIHIPAESFFAFEGFFIVVNGLILSRYWTYLSKKDKFIPLPTKFGIALVLIGCGYLFLKLLLWITGGLVPLKGITMIWAYCFFAAGELFLGPLGISMVGKLSPPGQEGYFMGVWTLFTGLGGVLGGWVAILVIIPDHMSFSESSHVYGHWFMLVGIIGVILGFIMMAFSPWLKKLI
jgi:POT family proton-dependent oligopeptide transporter